MVFQRLVYRRVDRFECGNSIVVPAILAHNERPPTNGSDAFVDWTRVAIAIQQKLTMHICHVGYAKS